MPIVSEHPRATDVIKRLEIECDSDLQTFVDDYAEQRKVYRESRDGSGASARLRDEDREELSPRELVAMLEARELRAWELQDELELLSKELVLIQRELRRVRRKLREGGIEYVPEYQPQPRNVTSNVASIRDRVQGQTLVQQIREGQSLPWLKPWLRGFLPNSG